MLHQDFSITLVVSQSAPEVFCAINNVRQWWSADVVGHSHHLHDEFEVRFGDAHYSRQQLTEVIPDQKVMWRISASRLGFLQDESEWTGTSVSFALLEQAGHTHVRFTHHGLTPAVECFESCSNGWTQYVQHSLLPLITTGQGHPYVSEAGPGTSAKH